MDTPIYIWPIWKTTYYALDEDVDTVMYRIVAEDGEVIFTGRARKRPDEEYIFINLNKPCQNHIDSIITPGLGARRSNGYRAFSLQFKFDGTEAGWDTWEEFAFYNDWSYEERSNGDDAPASVNQSEPINGHAAPGMLIPSTYVITGESEEVCYEEVEPVPPVPPTPEYERMYLTFEIISGGTIGVRGLGSACTVYYSTDSGSTWNSLAGQSGYTGESFEVEAGDIIFFKRGSGALKVGFTSTAYFNVYGNILSLQYGDDFYGKNMVGDYCFQELFMGTNVVDASNLFLPSNVLRTGCFSHMFINCAYLTEAPELPATALTEVCYSAMFALCTSLTESPVLPASVLPNYCYDNMFEGCTNLTKITCLATEITTYFSTHNWTNGVSPTGTFIKAASMSSWSIDRDGIPSGWTVIDYSN